MCTLMLRHWRAWVRTTYGVRFSEPKVRTTCGVRFSEPKVRTTCGGSIQRAEGGCEAGMCWFT